MTRHAILYDVVRWRGNRVILLVPATLLAVLAVGVAAAKHDVAQAGLYPFVAVFLYSLALSLWLRQRLSYAEVVGEELTVRVGAMRRRVPLSAVRRARVANLSAVFNRPDRLRLLPGRRRYWLDRPAVILRLERDPDDLIALRRGLGARYVIENELVIPVADPGALLAEVERGRPQPARSRGAGRDRRRRR